MIHQQFTKRLQAQDQVVATTYNYQKDAPYLDLTMEHIPIQDFRTFMFFTLEEQEKPTAIQKFIVPKTSKNFMIKCHFSQTISIIEKQTNNNNFYDTKIALEERVATFEGPVHLSKSENIVSNSLIDQVNQAIREIQQHIQENSGTRILSGVFYFKIDKADNLVLIFAQNIKTDKVEIHTKDGVQIRLKLASATLYNSQADSSNNLPALFQQTNTTVSSSTQGKNNANSRVSRPQSNYGRIQTNRLKTQECPFCDTIIEDSKDGLDVNINQVLKIYNYHKENTDFPLELISQPHNFEINQKINGLFVNQMLKQDDQSIPTPILKIHPNMTVEKYKLKRNDPLFLYESVKICDQCYNYVKLLLEFINFQKEELPKRSLPPQSLNRDIPFSNNKIVQQKSESLTSDQMSQNSHQKPYIKKQSATTRPQTSSVYQSLSKNKQSLLLHSSQQSKDIQVLFEDSSNTNEQFKQLRNTFGKRSGSERGVSGIAINNEDKVQQQMTNSTSSARLQPILTQQINQNEKKPQNTHIQSSKNKLEDYNAKILEESCINDSQDISKLYKNQQDLQDELDLLQMRENNLKKSDKPQNIKNDKKNQSITDQSQSVQNDDLNQDSIHNQSDSQIDESQQEIKQSPQQTGFMMFAKVEQGKEVASYNIKSMDNRNSHSYLQQIQEVQPKLEQSKIIEQNNSRSDGNPAHQTDKIIDKLSKQHKQTNNHKILTDKNFQRVIAGMDQQQKQKSSTTNTTNRMETKYNKMMAKIEKNKEVNTSKGGHNSSQTDMFVVDWEKEYHMKVKQKTEKAQDGIFKMLDKIESGQFDSQAFLSDSMDLKLYDENSTQQIIVKNQHQARCNQNIPQQQFQQQQMRPSLLSQSSFQNQNQQQNEFESGLNIKDSKMFEKVYDSVPSFSEKKMQPKMQYDGQVFMIEKMYKVPQSMNSQANIRSHFPQPLLPMTTSQTKGYQQIYKENIIQTNSMLMKTQIKSANRARPQSSKPPLNRNLASTTGGGIPQNNYVGSINNQMVNVELELDPINPLFSNQTQSINYIQPHTQQYQNIKSNNLVQQQYQNGNNINQQQQTYMNTDLNLSNSAKKKQNQHKQPKQRTKSANRTTASKRLHSAQNYQQQQTTDVQLKQITSKPSDKNAQNEVKKGGGLFDFQNMTEKDIEQIAENADTLIQIIQNIKNTSTKDEPVQAQTQSKTMFQRNSILNRQRSNIAEEPCFEEDEEDECTQEEGLNVLESQRSKRNSVTQNLNQHNFNGSGGGGFQLMGGSKNGQEIQVNQSNDDEQDKQGNEWW
eukprot:403361932